MGVVLIVAVLACIIGWHVSKVLGSHRGIPGRRSQVRLDRKGRLRYGIRLVMVAAALALVLALGWLVVGRA